MNLKKVLKNNSLKIWLFCFFTSFIVFMFISKNSFLYSFNEWEDIHAFFTVGKSMMNGKVPYKDIFEQKGPFLYFLYGISYLISNTTFIGIFILEVISSTISLYYIHKIISLYFDEKKSFWLIPILMTFIYYNLLFWLGGSCEELILPILIITIYYLLKYARDRFIKYGNLYVIGFLAGLIFLMKYTLLGVNFAFMLYIFIDLLINKKIKRAFLSCMVYLSGMLTPIIPWLIYFIINNALFDFFDTYILINLFCYSKNSNTIFMIIFRTFKLFIKNLKYSKIFLFYLISGVIFIISIFFDKKYLREKIAVLTCFIFAVIFIYIGSIYYIYYGFPLLIFLSLFLIYDCIFIKKFINYFKYINIKKICFKLKPFSKLIYAIYYIIIIMFITSLNHNAFFIGKDKNDYIAYQVRDIILEEDNPTILNYGWLDWGIYTVTNTIPNVKHFEKQNLDYDRYSENIDSQNYYIENKMVDFVIVCVQSINDSYPVSEYLDINYEKVKQLKGAYNYNSLNYTDLNYILYKLKEDKE